MGNSLASLEYIKRRDHYFFNAEKQLSKGNLGKASELLWGAAVCAIRLHASTHGHNLRGAKHNQLKAYVTRLSADKKSPELKENFNKLKTLHRNFYEEDIDKEDYPVYYIAAKDFIGQLKVIGPIDENTLST